MSAEGRVEHQQLNQLDSLEKIDSSKILNREEDDVICGWPLMFRHNWLKKRIRTEQCF